jgi:hypothetical protein
MATPPQLTPEQRAAALAKAAEARAARAEIKVKLKQGSMTVADALASSDPNVGKLKVVSMLESLPGLGKVKARKIMEEVGIADNRKIQGLGAQQKKALLEHLAKGANGFPRPQPPLVTNRASSSSRALVGSAKAPSSMR